MVQRDVAARFGARPELPPTEASASPFNLQPTQNARLHFDPTRSIHDRRSRAPSSFLSVGRCRLLRCATVHFFGRSFAARFAYRRKTLANSLAFALGVERRDVAAALSRLGFRYGDTWRTTRPRSFCRDRRRAWPVEVSTSAGRCYSRSAPWEPHSFPALHSASSPFLRPTRHSSAARRPDGANAIEPRSLCRVAHTYWCSYRLWRNVHCANWEFERSAGRNRDRRRRRHRDDVRRRRACSF